MKLTIACLPEPLLGFGQNSEGLEPRRQLAKAGPADSGRFSEIRVGLVGLDEDVAATRHWLGRLGHFLPAREANAARYRDWPGAPRALGVRFVFDDRHARTIDSTRVELAWANVPNGSGFQELLDLFDARINGLLGDSQPDCIVVCLPERLADLRVANPGLSAEERRALERLRVEEEQDQLLLFQPTPEELKAAEELRTQADDLLFRTFYRALKARAMMHVNPVPIQVIRRDTVDRPDDKGQSAATRAWNLATSLYYKAGGIPWRPAQLPENVCFIGISFHHMKRRGGDVVYASLAQAFSNEIEPFALKGATLPHDQRRDKQPYLIAEQADSLVSDVLAQYEARAGVAPARVVVHKTTTYQPEEIDGFRTATRNRVAATDLIWIRNTPFRLLRRGHQEPWRGTLCIVGTENYLFTSGYVPWWSEYPGPYIPAPVQIGSASDTDIRQRAHEILALTKMNWNTTEGISRYPVTLSFAKKVGQLMTELPDNCSPNPSYRFYM